MLLAVRLRTSGAASHVFALLLGTLALNGCSLKSASRSTHLSLSLPNPVTSRSSLTSSGAHAYASANGSTAGGAPTAWNAPEFVCYGVNVTGPGIADTSFNPDPNPSISALIAGTTSCAYRGVVSNGFTFTAGQSDVTVDLQVPPGATRVIQLIGITNPAYCATNFLESGSATNPGAYEIGRATTDLFADTSVAIPITYTASETKRVDCGNGSSSAATVGPFVTITSPASGTYITAANSTLTLTGTCSEEGQPVELSGFTGASAINVTCAGGAYSAILHFSAVPDGPVDVKADHFSAANVPATQAWKTYNKDTVVPSAAVSLGWATASPSTSVNIVAAWSVSSSPDLSFQSIQFHAGTGCAAPVGTPINVGPGLSQVGFTAPADGYYSYAVTSYDVAGNAAISPCSAPMIVDTAVTQPATNLLWSPNQAMSNSYSLSVNWTPSASPTVATQKIQFYSDGICSTPTGTLTDLMSTSVSTQSFTVPADGTFTYKIFTFDTLAFSISSGCSTPITIDTGLPAPVTNLAWAQVSPVNTVNVNATWTKSVSADVVSQALRFYSDTNCSNQVGTQVNLNNSVSTYAFTAPGDGTYYYAIFAIDGAANTILSSCSTGITMDTTPPALASAVAMNGLTSTLTHVFNLAYGAVTGAYTQYCILENNTNVGSCAFTTGSLPPSFPVTAASGPKTLSIWLKDAAGNLSTRVDANSVIYDASCDLMLASGNGAVGSPYQISNYTQLTSCLPTLDAPGIYFKVIAPISLATMISPIAQLLGNFDGGNQSLTGLNMNSAVNNVGLFAYVAGGGGGGLVQNVYLTAPTITCGSSQTGCGTIAGYATGNATFANNTVTSPTVTGFNNVGGVVGTANGAVVFTGNKVQGITLNIATGGTNSGGIVGSFTKSSVYAGTDFSNNIVQTSIVNTCGSQMGGIVGTAAVAVSGNTLTFASNAARLNMNCGSSINLHHIGGLVGSVVYSGGSSDVVTIKDSDLAGNMALAASTTFAGGVVGGVTTGVGISNSIIVADAVVRGTFTGISVGAYFGGTDNVGPGLSYNLQYVFWLSQTFMTAATTGSFYGGTPPTATPSSGVTAGALTSSTTFTAGNFANASVWTVVDGVLPRLLFESTTL